MADEIVIHQAPWRTDWYATQDAVRGVLVCDKTADEHGNLVAAPAF